MKKATALLESIYHLLSNYRLRQNVKLLNTVLFTARRGVFLEQCGNLGTFFMRSIRQVRSYFRMKGALNIQEHPFPNNNNGRGKGTAMMDVLNKKRYRRRCSYTARGRV